MNSQPIIEEFRQSLSQVRADGTTKTYSFGIARFLEFLEVNSWKIETAPANVLDLFVQHACQGLQPWSVFKYVSATKQFIAWHKRKGIQLPEFSEPLMPRIREREAVCLQDSQLAECVAVARTLAEPWRTAVQIILASGFRGSEVLALQRKDIEIRKKEVKGPDGKPQSRTEVFLHIKGRIHLRNGKSAKDRGVPLLPRATAILFAYVTYVRPKMPKGPWIFPTRNGRPASIRELEKKIALIGKAMKLERLTPHDLRHSAITHFGHCGVPLRTIQLIAGHEHIATTMRYIHGTPSDLYDQVASRVKQPWLEEK